MKRAVRVFAMLSCDTRWAILRLLAARGEMIATEVAEVLGRDFDGVSKHLRLMREAGVLEWRIGAQDRRLVYFFIPERARRTPGWLDFGVCTVRLD